MERKIPSDQKVKEIIKDILKSRLKIVSQEELAQLALIELRKEDKNFTLSPMRAKRVALQIPEIEVRAKTRKTIRMQRIDKCPICESVIEEIKIKNLLNKPIVVGYRCVTCGYQSDLEAFMPMEYIFILKSVKV